MTAAPEPKKTIKRDTLAAIEEEMQAYWEKEKVFEVDAPSDPNAEKYMVSFPYPYMNGRLHLGHSFSLSKCEFAAGYQRMLGKHVLFPFGFHCTGMPIKACADKLKREMEMYGNPPQFPVEEEVVEGQDESGEAESKVSDGNAAQGFKKKGKVASKATGKKYQWEIMKSIGVDEKEIPKFSDANYWLHYFPPIAMADLKRFGVRVDWRRAFITTDVNPYYDSFVRWQFRKLKDLDKIKFGKRYTIFSPLDNQPCMDHDRQTGEGVAPQEYTIIKIQVLEVPESMSAALGDKNVFLPAATLRPETMYGQTNCYVGPSLDYGAYLINDTEVFICTERSALNLAYQGYAKEEGKLVKLLSLKGQDLVGLPVKAPLAAYERVYVLPMESVLATKGTGVVTSVPSDSPDDFATLADLKKKVAFYKIKEEWVKPFEPIPIIDTPNYGNLAAAKVCEELKINSPKDRKLLDLAKEKVYKEGFYSGKMLMGECKGMSVQDAKPKIRQQMIDANQAIPYWEPEGLVMSRSGDECVVCLTDQWYLNYGEENWKQQALQCLSQLNTYHEEVRNSFVRTLDWLREWACSRSYGLGSRLPWDEQWLIESLSDSTIYMAYYTIAHLLQQGSLDGSKPGSLNIKPEEMTDEVWDYIFRNAPMPTQSIISSDKMELLKKQFTFFYPLDLRVSGKDLVSNHLTFFIYNHAALFEKKFWPQGIRANGHLLINNEKMSKSTGNFLSLSESVDKFSADGTRFALAEAGDGVEDANFDMERANAAILKLFNLKDWMETVKAEIQAGHLTEQYRAQDEIFENDMNRLIGLTGQNYDNMLYYEACKYGFHELSNARDRYILFCSTTGEPLNKDLVLCYIEVQALLMAPILPHFCEFTWRTILQKPKSIMRAAWPKVTKAVDSVLLAKRDYIDKVLRESRLDLIQETQPKKKKGGNASQESIIPPKRLILFVAKSFPEWQESIVEFLRRLTVTEKKLPEIREISNKLAKEESTKELLKNKRLMPFVREMKDVYDAQGSQGFERSLPFDEFALLQENSKYIRLSLGMEELKIVDAATASGDAETKKAQNAVPGNPACFYQA